MRRVDERVVELIAGRDKDHVVLFAAPVLEPHRLAVEPVHVGHHPDVAVARVVKHQRIHDRMAFVEFVIGLGKAVFLRVAHEPFQDRAVHDPLQRHRQFDRAAQRVGGFAEHVFRDEVIAAPHRQVAGLPMMDRVHRDIAAGIARPDHQHPLAVELRGVPIVRRMDHLAREAALETGHVRGRQRAVGDQQARVILDMLAGVVAPCDAPAVVRAAQRIAAQNLGPEPEMAVKVEMPGEVLKIPLHLAMRRILRHLVAHREIGELGHPLGRNEMRAFVHGRARPVDVPQPADVAVQLESLKPDPVLRQQLGRRQSHRPRPDQGEPLARLTHRVPPFGLNLNTCSK